MKFWLVIGLLFSYQIHAAAIEPSTLLEKPLIIGASISSEYTRVQSPGHKLSLKFTTEDQIYIFAQAGRRGVDVLAAAGPDFYNGRSVIIGFDLMFWDSGSSVPAASIGAFWTLLDKLTKAGVPIIIGDVPTLLTSMQPGADILNQEIRLACSTQPSCILLPLDQLFKEAKERGYIEFRGQRYTVRDFLPDGLHLSDIGSEYMAEFMLITLQSHVWGKSCETLLAR